MKREKEEEQTLLLKPSRSFRHLPSNKVEKDRKKEERKNRRWEQEEDND